jgi:outer membrane receptor protein involved in Fe transport
MSRTTLKPWLAVWVALALGQTPSLVMAQAQSAGGSIEGSVTDESGAVLPGATVTVRHQATGIVRETSTDGSGMYRAPLLPVGSYEVTAALSGFATTRRPNLTLTIGQGLTVDLVLKVATTQEEVTVTADAPILEATRTHQASTVGERAVANLPVNGRNFIDFVLTTPGVSRDTRGGDISFAGQRGTLNSLVIDGADNNNTFFGQTLGRTGSGRAPYQFSQDAVQEFQVNRSAYSAEYGRAGGAVINVVTKSGTNDLHGSAFEFFRDKSLNANSYNNKIQTPIREKAPFRIHQFGASLGGPIVKDRAFFFASYDGQRQTIPNPVILTLPANLPTDPDTQAGLAKVEAKANDYDRARDQDVFLAKVDFQMDPRHRLTVRYNHQNYTGQNGETSGTTNAEEHSGDSLVRTRSVNASVASVFSPTFFNEVRFQWAQDKEPGEANTNDPETLVNQFGQRVLTFGRNNFSPRETTIKRFQVADTATWVRGVHSLKVGFDYNHDDILNFFPGFFGGNYTFASLASFNRGVPSGTGESFQQNFAGLGTTGATTEPNINEFAMFVQDEWRLNKDVTLSLGVRYDLQSFAKPQVRNPDAQLAAAGIDTSFLNTDKNNIAPRLGLVYRPSERTVVRAGYGLFYGRTPSIMVGTAHSNNGVNVISVRLTGNQVPTYPSVLQAPPTGVAGVRPSIFVFDRDFENPEVHQWSAGVERSLSDDIAVAVSYLGVAGRKLQRSTDINIGTPVATQVPISTGGALTVDRFPAARPFTAFDRIIEFQSSAESSYNGVTLELRKRYRNNLQASLAYTLGKVEDTKPDATAVVPGNAGDDAKYASNPADFEADRADGDNDVRHRAVFSGLWDLAYWSGSTGAAKALLDGWSLSWIMTAQSGLPYNERVSNDLNNDGNRFNDIVPGARNAHRLPSIFNVDLRLSKRIPMGSQARLELIAEAFNLLNSTNITSQRDTLYNFTGTALVPQVGLSNPRLDFGADVGTQINFEDTQRIVQIAAKVTF